MPTYNWQVPNFTKPAKDNLIVYELLVRDFTIEQNWQSMIDKIPVSKIFENKCSRINASNGV